MVPDRNCNTSSQFVAITLEIRNSPDSCNEPLKFIDTLLLLHIKHRFSTSVVTQCQLKCMHDLVNGSHRMASSEDDPLCYDLPSTTLVYIFSLCIHHLWNTWSTKVTIQYANLEDKETTQRLAIYCHQAGTAVTIHS